MDDKQLQALNPELVAETIFIPRKADDPMAPNNHILGIKLATCGIVITFDEGTDPTPIIRKRTEALAAFIEEKMLAAIKEPA